MNKVLEYILPGYSFRSKVEDDPHGDLEVVQMKNLTHAYTKIGKGLSRIRGVDINRKYLLQKGDVLFLAKGKHNYACVYTGESGNTVAASAFFVLRPKSAIDSSFLAWYINQEPVQKYLKENKSGTYTLNVNKSVVERMPLKAPLLNIQKLIIQTNELQNQEQELLDLIKEKKTKLISTQLLSTIK